MSYRLRWKHSALEELADPLTDADSSDRREINQAVSSIEQELARAPLQAGESRTAGNRIGEPSLISARSIHAPPS